MKRLKKVPEKAFKMVPKNAFVQMTRNDNQEKCSCSCCGTIPTVMVHISYHHDHFFTHRNSVPSGQYCTRCFRKLTGIQIEAYDEASGTETCQECGKLLRQGQSYLLVAFGKEALKVYHWYCVDSVVFGKLYPPQHECHCGKEPTHETHMHPQECHCGKEKTSSGSGTANRFANLVAEKVVTKLNASNNAGLNPRPNCHDDDVSSYIKWWESVFSGIHRKSETAQQHETVQHTFFNRYWDPPIPAHRHVNPDGSEGGWVAETAQVDPSVYVGPNSEVFEFARVFKNVRLEENTVVSGSARLSGNALIRNVHVMDHAQIFGNAKLLGDDVYTTYTVTGNACIDGSAEIRIPGSWSLGDGVFLQGGIWEKPPFVVRSGSMTITQKTPDLVSVSFGSLCHEEMEIPFNPKKLKAFAEEIQKSPDLKGVTKRSFRELLDFLSITCSPNQKKKQPKVKTLDKKTKVTVAKPSRRTNPRPKLRPKPR
jgi:hypothetical protein